MIQVKEGLCNRGGERILDYEYEPKVKVNRACSVARGERGKGDIKLCALTMDLDEVRRNFSKIKKRDYEDIEGLYKLIERVRERVKRSSNNYAHTTIKKPGSQSLWYACYLSFPETKAGHV